jgi:hypothetical protein
MAHHRRELRLTVLPTRSSNAEQLDRARGDHRQGEPWVRYLLRQVPRCRRRLDSGSGGESARHRSTARPQGLAEARDQRGRGAVRRAGHPGLLELRPAVHALREVLHGCCRAVDAESPDAHRGRLARDRQSAGRLPKPGEHPLRHPVAAHAAGAGGEDLGKLRRLCVRVRHRAGGQEAGVGTVREGRSGGDAPNGLLGLRRACEQRASSGQSRGQGRRRW